MTCVPLETEEKDEIGVLGWSLGFTAPPEQFLLLNHTQSGFSIRTHFPTCFEFHGSTPSQRTQGPVSFMIGSILLLFAPVWKFPLHQTAVLVT